DVTEDQGVGDAGVDTGRGRPWIEPRCKTVGNAKVDAVRAEGALLRDAQSSRVLAFDLALHCVVIGKARCVDLETGLVRTGDVAIPAADADVVVDGDDAVGPLPRRRGRTDVHAGRIGAVLTTDRNESPGHVRERSRLDIEDLAPLHRRRCRVGMPARGGTGLAADAALKIGDDRPARHGAASTRLTLTFTRSALEPVASVRSSSIGINAFMLGAFRSLANGVAQWSNCPIISSVSGRMPSVSIARPLV